MICSKPIHNAAGQAFGCGQCLACRINRRRVWSTRIMVEAAQYQKNCFATLTYADDSQYTLDPDHLRLFLNRLREHYARKYNDRLRFFAVGEYGETSWRPHYHAALFNFPTCRWGQSWYDKTRLTCCDTCELVRSIWGHGHIYLGTLEADSAQYVAGYILKKMTGKDDERLGNRYPEFARMSRNPGVGGVGTHKITDAFLRHRADDPDVPNSLRVDGKHRPLGRYMMKRVRKEAGRDEKAPQAVLDKQEAELFDVRMAARADEENPSFNYHYREKYSGKIARAEFFSKLKNRRKL